MVARNLERGRLNGSGGAARASRFHGLCRPKIAGSISLRTHCGTDIRCCAGPCAIMSRNFGGHWYDSLPVERIYRMNRRMLRSPMRLRRGLSLF
jgi:hypothetical protein